MTFNSPDDDNLLKPLDKRRRLTISSIVSDEGSRFPDSPSSYDTTDHTGPPTASPIPSHTSLIFSDQSSQSTSTTPEVAAARRASQIELRENDEEWVAINRALALCGSGDDKDPFTTGSITERDRIYQSHYITNVTPQLAAPDHSRNNPFRILLANLAPADPALLHAILALGALDLVNSCKRSDRESSRETDPDRFVETHEAARRHYETAARLLAQQSVETRHRQSCASLAACLLLSVYSQRSRGPDSGDPLETALQVIQARASAGRTFEGGAWLTWYLATFDVLSSMFGGRGSIITFVVDHGLVPIAGQGYISPETKKTEDERIEHTVISPMYGLFQELLLIAARLGLLSKTRMQTETFDGLEFTTSLRGLQDKLETTWLARPKLVDDLMKDQVEQVFLTRWKRGIPLVQQTFTFYLSLILYIDLLSPGFLPRETLVSASTYILTTFAVIVKERTTFMRRFILFPVFVAGIVSPDLVIRENLIALVQKVEEEGAWKTAREVMQRTLVSSREQMKKTGVWRGTEWAQIAGELKGMVLL